ncbi:hypothetical protein [Asticcacaulis excentricus]|uniref:Uncharacterized protein n=1 Tax=Asticcacaulis excentricus (strain ATCC 15261 / DSM 4724 / KCTC 12464 / NCIMB 9791 / VKM B-1370 / CB 48) TaxID=573065 RepID=E8RPS5_ASTEC|nr:hypothetical protein [Asticcacaulis excentricus]ADU12052.1 hypothetical protein Astex_0356 [Asticcacaulis excentricus CB 48]
MIEHRYSFFWVSDEMAVGELDGLMLAVCPHVGDEFVAVADGAPGEARYLVERVRHTLVKDWGGKTLQQIDLFIQPKT